MTLVQTGQKKKRIKNTGIPKTLYDEIRSYSWQQLENFLQNLSKNKNIITKQQEKGCDAFVRIPNILLEKNITCEKDRIIFILTVHYFNYGQSNKLLKFTAFQLDELLWTTEDIEPTVLAKEINGNYDIINVKYVRPFFRITPAIEENIDKSQNEEIKIKKEKSTTNKDKDIKQDNNKISKYINLKLLKAIQFDFKSMAMGNSMTYDSYVELSKPIMKIEEENEEDDIWKDILS